MQFEGNISGLDDLQRQIEDAYFNKLIEIGRDAVIYAQRNGEYKNHTYNLRNAPGFCVVRNGQIFFIWR